ncbi:acetate kinase [Acidovorax carolinensis]|uniref:Acetate kinase n=1 Tax=Acidovorax carolinensis TaxID=553814 RepID=A0A240U0Q2_9BURK|nr:acetate kinase [Acidovorax carolinensis]ART51412.1 acetate kinase [Acidovorax carolinensis]
MALSSAMVQAQSLPARQGIGQRLEALEEQVSAQRRQIEAMQRQVLDQEARYRDLERSVAEAARNAPQPVTAEAAPAGKAPADTGERPVQVGVAPAVDNQPPAVAPLFDQPGILTQPGHYVLEPSLQYGYSSSNRVALVGYTVIPALLIGLIDVREVKRNTLTAALTGRWGLTRRLEVEMKVPYVYRSDNSISREIFTGSASEQAFNSSGRDIGDIEFAARYQLNEPKGNDPYLIGSLRFKTRTGKDPFEVVTDCVTRCLGNTTGTGLPLDLPTGSGFYSLQPSLTWLLPSDPAVFFGGISYTHNFGRSNVSRRVLAGEQEFIGSVKPGDVWGINFGMGLALNDRSSFSVGIDLNSVGRTKQNGVNVPSSVRTQLSSLLLGYSYRYSNRTTLNVTVGAGLTRDTPDLTLSVRLPMSF